MGLFQKSKNIYVVHFGTHSEYYHKKCAEREGMLRSSSMVQSLVQRGFVQARYIAEAPTHTRCCLCKKEL